MGHVNNVAYAAYFEAGRIDFLNSLLAGMEENQSSMVIASLKIDYVAEMFYPGTVEVGSYVGSVGNKSFSVISGAFKEGQLHAQAQSILVFLDEASHAPAPIPSAMRNSLNSLLPAAKS